MADFEDMLYSRVEGTPEDEAEFKKYFDRRPDPSLVIPVDPRLAKLLREEGYVVFVGVPEQLPPNRPVIVETLHLFDVKDDPRPEYSADNRQWFQRHNKRRAK